MGTGGPLRLKTLTIWQGQKDLNPRHAVLETAALPTELYPFALYRSTFWLLSADAVKEENRKADSCKESKKM